VSQSKGTETAAGGGTPAGDLKALDHPRFLDPDFSGESHIERIREILFGAQMRRYESMFNRLKERMEKEVSDLRGEVSRRLDSLEGYVRKEMASLGTELRQAREGQAEAVREMGRELKDRNDFYKEKMGRLNDQMAKSHRTLRRQILDEANRLSDDLRKRQEETLAMLDRATRELHADRIDRATLSNIFQEISVRLNRDMADRINQELEKRLDE